MRIPQVSSSSWRSRTNTDTMTQNDIFKALAVLVPDGLTPGELTVPEGSDSPQNYEEYAAWHASPFSESDMLAALETFNTNESTRKARRSARDTMRAEWEALGDTSPLIYGAFDHVMRGVIRLLEKGQDAAAIQLIEGADVPSMIDATEAANLKAAFVAKVQALSA